MCTYTHLIAPPVRIITTSPFEGKPSSQILKVNLQYGGKGCIFYMFMGKTISSKTPGIEAPTLQQTRLFLKNFGKDRS